MLVPGWPFAPFAPAVVGDADGTNWGEKQQQSRPHLLALVAALKCPFARSACVCVDMIWLILEPISIGFFGMRWSGFLVLFGMSSETKR